MRTIAATFMTEEEAAAACRRLEEIGVAPDRIQSGRLEGAGSEGIFVSAKVAPEQMKAAKAILDSPPQAAEPSMPEPELPRAEGRRPPVSAQGIPANVPETDDGFRVQAPPPEPVRAAVPPEPPAAAPVPQRPLVSRSAEMSERPPIVARAGPANGPPAAAVDADTPARRAAPATNTRRQLLIAALIVILAFFAGLVLRLAS
ncbi:MAG TPA: hypothetical protein VGD10_05475 [Allosphingosinicella sp.]|uniref:hypothetical protein n=1 Tax=Allosphingosinicella sp. TaxID=2823234 RepID=UPI002EDA1359